MAETLPEVRVILALTGDALDFSELVGLGLPEPARRRRRGDPQATGLPPSPETVWAYEVREADSSIEGPIKHFLDQLEPLRALLPLLLKKPGVCGGLRVNVTIYGDRPLYCLSAEMLARLASLQVDFCLDIFDYSE